MHGAQARGVRRRRGAGQADAAQQPVADGGVEHAQELATTAFALLIVRGLPSCGG